MFVLSLILACGPKKDLSTQASSEPVSHQVVPQAELQNQEAVDQLNPPSETKGIQSVEVLGAIPLSVEFEGIESDVFFRMRRLVVAPDGVVAAHEHQARPGVAYIVSGEIDEFRDAQAVTRKKGDLSFEQTGVTHWWENRSGEQVTAIVVDILSSNDIQGDPPYQAKVEHTARESQGLDVQALGTLDLSAEHPALKDRILRARHIEVAPDGAVGFHRHEGRPSFAYLLEGEMLEYRDDRESPIHHTSGTVAAERNGLGHWWKNGSEQPALFLVVDIVSAE